MKKFLFIAIAALTAVAANAQLMTSRTFFGKESNTVWFLRAGMSINTISGKGADGTNSNIGYDVNFGFQKPIASSAVYWGMDLGLSTRGFGVDYYDNYYEESVSGSALAYDVRFTPITFGYKYKLNDNIAFDGHLGGFLSYDFAKNSDAKSLEDWQDFDAGLQVGVGVWWKRFNLDFTYQRGFVKIVDGIDAYSSNFLIRLGVAF